MCILPNTPPPPTLLCARAALLRARTSCEKLPSDFIETLPTSITQYFARDAFEGTPLHKQGIARSLRRIEGYSVDDETGTIATFEEGVETIEMRDDKQKVVKVIIKNGAITIAERAFADCILLAVVSVPTTLETIGGNCAFAS